MAIQNQRVESLMRAAASLLGVPHDEIAIGRSKSGDSRTFRRQCIAFLMAEMDLPLSGIAVAMSKSESWVDEARSAVRQRMGFSSPFAMSMSMTLAELRLDSPAVARFRSIRSLVARQGGPSSSDSLNSVAALLTLADFVAAGDESVG
jgi:hypothetical protein